MTKRCPTCFLLKRTVPTNRRSIFCCPVFIKPKERPQTRNRKCVLMPDCSVKQAKLSRGKQVMPSRLRVRLSKNRVCSIFRKPLIPAGFLLLFGALQLNADSQEQMSSQQNGVSTGGVFPPVHDAEHRPITAGGFADQGPIVFRDMSQSSGLTTWHYAGGTPAKAYI